MPIAKSFLDSLSRAAREAYPFIQRAVREGLPANDIQDALQAAGIGIRRQTLLDIVRQEQGIQLVGDTLKFIPKGFLPNPDRLPEALTTIRREFAYTVLVRGVVAATGLTLLQHVTISSSENMTREEIEDAASSIAQEGQSEQAVDVIDATLIRGVRAGAAGTL